MPVTDPRVDAYIAKSNDFARPILEHLRSLVHKACPDVQETMKWGFPHFEYKGILCSMAAFKQHCSFGFWKASLMKDPEKILTEGDGMGHLGKITSLSDLPSNRVLIAYIRQAATLNDEGIKVRRAKSPPTKGVRVPSDLASALKKNTKASQVFEAMSPSHKREYIEWLVEAKKPETRARRLATALQWLAKGKSRNWKYEK